MFAAFLLVAAQPPLVIPTVDVPPLPVVIPVVGIQPPAPALPVAASPPLAAPPLILPPVPQDPKSAAPAPVLPPPLKDFKTEPKPAELLPPPLKEFSPAPKAVELPPPALAPMPLDLPKRAPELKPLQLPVPNLEFPKPTETPKITLPAPVAPPVKSAAAPPPPTPVQPVLPLPATPASLSVKSMAGTVAPTASTPTPAPGETPMPLTARQFALTALAGTALLNAPLQAKEDPKVEPAKASEVASLKKQVDELTTAVEQLKRSQKDIRELLEGTDRAGDDGLLKVIKKLDAGVVALDGKLKAFDSKLDAMRTANASPLSGSTPTAAGKATVRIVNEYPIDISMLVNGKPYKLSANTSKDVPVDVGTFKYQLLNTGLNEVVSPVKENETVTLRIK